MLFFVIRKLNSENVWQMSFNNFIENKKITKPLHDDKFNVIFHIQVNWKHKNALPFAVTLFFPAYFRKLSEFAENNFHSNYVHLYLDFRLFKHFAVNEPI